jgi:hypothetical protein
MIENWTGRQGRTRYREYGVIRPCSFQRSRFMSHQLFESDVFPILCISLVGLAAIVVFGVGTVLVKLLRIYADYHLKSQMLDRGLSPAEIEQVLKAHSHDFANEVEIKKSRMIEKTGSYIAGRS